MVWKKASDAARDWCGGISPKLLYAAVQAGRLKAGRVGAGRNLLFCETWCDEWLLASVERTVVDTTTSGQPIAVVRRRA